MKREHGTHCYEVSPVSHVGIIDTDDSTVVYEADATGVNKTEHRRIARTHGGNGITREVRDRLTCRNPGRVLRAMCAASAKAGVRRVVFYKVEEV